jgi:phage-related protein (TIGR01555 family)
MKKTLKTIKDGFTNILKGLGGNKDAREYVYYQKGLHITEKLANDLYTYNWLFKKIVDIPVDDATRKWITLLISDQEQKIAFREAADFYKVREKLNQAEKWSRVFGGAAIVAIIDGQDQAEPLNLAAIRPQSLINFVVLDRYNIYSDVNNREILSPNFGEPEFYTVARGGQRIHHTRVLKFKGVIPSIREYEQDNYWGKPILTALYDPVSDSQVVSQSINNLIYESNVDVYRIAGLNSLVAQSQNDLVIQRLKIASQMKSIINGIAIDKEDEYDKKTNSFANLDSIDDRFMQKATGAADIPLTRILGISPSGMNATGESDMLNYHDNVQSMQENKLRQKIDWMFQVINASEFGSTDKIEFEFKPLKQLTEIEKATVESQRATRDQTYIDNGIITSVDVMAQLAENGTYVTIDENRVEEEKELEELGFEGE